MTPPSPIDPAASQAHWRPMTAADLDGLVDVARVSFPHHFEDRSCFAERFALYPKGCFILDAGRGEVAGYLIAYPWHGSSAPPLDSLLGALPDDADVIYLHDLALRPDARGQGHTGEIVERLAEQARGEGWRAIALVAVNEATAFWQKMGFLVAADPAMAGKLASYGADARYMLRDLSEPQD